MKFSTHDTRDETSSRVIKLLSIFMMEIFPLPLNIFYETAFKVLSKYLGRKVMNEVGRKQNLPLSR